MVSQFWKNFALGFVLGIVFFIGFLLAYAFFLDMGNELGSGNTNPTNTVTVTSTVTETKTLKERAETVTVTSLRTLTITKTVTKTEIVSGNNTPASTSTSSNPEKGWRIVAIINGSASKVSNSFNISSNKWRIKWSYIGNEYSLFSFEVYRIGGNLPVYHLIPVIKPKGSDVTYIYEGPGEYYMKVNAVNCDKWSIIIEEWVP